ncbi:MAG: orotidine-5'-phosphate decarboxylase [Bacteroidetes bacterium]|nr:orotidine-5'-phosphate decarboxylase [Bacteroidota bacterium]
MSKEELVEKIRQKQSFLCIGLDPDVSKIPEHLLGAADPVFEFNKAIIDATHPYCIAYKPNTAFYECLGADGWKSLEKTINYIPKDCLIIADAKRGDIGNTSMHYAKTFFETLSCDAVTIAPYMGSDSVKPFLNFPGKWVILLALTSNEGSQDFQQLKGENRRLFEEVIVKSQEWGTTDNLMYVIGATRSEDIALARKLAPEHFFLVPGVGAQGGSLDEVIKFGSTAHCGLIVNSARAIIYASRGHDFAEAAKKEALDIQGQMASYIQRYNW